MMGFRRFLYLVVIVGVTVYAAPALSDDASSDRAPSDSKGTAPGTRDQRRMRAAQLERERNWPELQRVAQAWAAEEPTNQFAWAFLGNARRELRDLDGA